MNTVNYTDARLARFYGVCITQYTKIVKSLQNTLFQRLISLKHWLKNAEKSQIQMRLETIAFLIEVGPDHGKSRGCIPASCADNAIAHRVDQRLQSNRHLRLFPVSKKTLAMHSRNLLCAIRYRLVKGGGYR